jgi:hypothetical protein
MRLPAAGAAQSNNHTIVKSFPLAPMSPLIRWLTVLLLAIPVFFVAMSATGAYFLSLPAVLLILIYAWVWLRFRPTTFMVYSDALEVIWPLKRRRIPREEITAIRQVDGDELTREIGWGTRVGAGGLWGGFGLLWTRRRGMVQMYISRTDGYVWIERGNKRPWLLTPLQPEDFIRALKE